LSWKSPAKKVWHPTKDNENCAHFAGEVQNSGILQSEPPWAYWLFCQLVRDRFSCRFASSIGHRVAEQGKSSDRKVPWKGSLDLGKGIRRIRRPTDAGGASRKWWLRRGLYRKPCWYVTVMNVAARALPLTQTEAWLAHQARSNGRPREVCMMAKTCSKCGSTKVEEINMEMAFARGKVEPVYALGTPTVCLDCGFLECVLGESSLVELRALTQARTIRSEAEERDPNSKC